MKPIITEKTNTKITGPKGFEFVDELPAEKQDIILSNTFTIAHTVTFELEPHEIEAIKNGKKEIVVTCIGFVPILSVGLEKADLEKFKNLYLDNRYKSKFDSSSY